MVLQLGFREICKSDIGDNFQERYHLFTYYLRMWVLGRHFDRFKRSMYVFSLVTGQYYHSVLGCEPNKLWQLPILMML